MRLPTPLVSTAWLAEHLGQRGLQVVDATAFLPTATRDARAEFEREHIPGAVFCDIDAVSDHHSPLPHTLVNEVVFAERMEALGIGSGDAVVVYDSSGQYFSAPRLWWMLRAFGHKTVAVLDGGLKRWKLDGRPLESGTPAVTPASFRARLDPTQVRTLESMQHNVGSGAEQMVDARSAGRFEGTEPEPRAGVRGGHIPGGRNLPYTRLVREDGTLRDQAELRTIVATAGLDLSRPIVASCGSGLTACAVVLALDVLGATSMAVYDGSWTEWGGRTDTDVETGPAR